MVAVVPLEAFHQHRMAVDEVEKRLERITSALTAEKVQYALVGGQAVALWVTTKDPATTRTSKNVDLLVRKEDLPRVRAAARRCNMEYMEVIGVGMLLEDSDPNPKKAVHLLWAGEKVRPEYLLPTPDVADAQILPPGLPVVDLIDLVCMKLQANRRHDLVHLVDMIEVGLIDRVMQSQLPAELAERLGELLAETGR